MAQVLERGAAATQKRNLWEAIAYKRLDVATKAAGFDTSLQITSAEDSNGKSLGVSISQRSELPHVMMLQARWSRRRVRIVVGHDEAVHTVKVASANKRVELRGRKPNATVEHAYVRGGNSKLTVKGFILHGEALSSRFWQYNRGERNKPNELTMKPSRAARKGLDVRTVTNALDDSVQMALIAEHDYNRVNKPGTVMIYAGGGRRREVATGREVSKILAWSPKSR